MALTTERAIARQHAEWLSLIEISGPFMSMPVLMESFPHGLAVHGDDSEVRRRIRLAYEEWLDNQYGLHPDPAIHYQWLRFVLEEVLGFQSVALLEGQAIPDTLAYEVREHGETLRPLLVLRSPYQPQPRLLIQQYPHTQSLTKVVEGRRWKVSPQTRMMELLRATGVRLGLLTNGRQWMLIDAPVNETTGFYTWDAALWTEEPLTLRAFRGLLSMERFFNVPAGQTLEELFTKSAQKQQEVTDQLGEQVRRAVEMLVHTLDRLDREERRARPGEASLLADVDERTVYEAALTVMMRLVFLLSAEEREMLLLGEPLYEQNYAVSTLYDQLREQADQQGEEVIGLRCDAWCRLLSLFRIVYAGVEHVNLSMPAYGGRLFDPDRFPFLEGRAVGSSWRDTPAFPLKIDNRTVLHLLRALQFLHIPAYHEVRRLSFRGLDVEQIGHVYEGLLDHTARRADTTILHLQGASGVEPEVTLEELEDWFTKGEAELLRRVAELTGRKEPTLHKRLGDVLGLDERGRLMEVCENRQDLFERVLPFVGWLRRDTFGHFMLVTPGSFYVTKGTDRRATGTHYTPRSLTEPIVQHALDPLVYYGPAEGLPQEQWRLHSPAELLDLKVCDMAMGSGAFLVQTCRYLAEKLVEAWEIAELELNGSGSSALPEWGSADDAADLDLAPAEASREAEKDGEDLEPIWRRPQITPYGSLSRGRPSDELLPLDAEERLSVARRLVAERCIYGVDKNPMATEMAKLSLWLITMAKNKPFTFLDHNLRCGDSLLGASEQQIKLWSMGSAKDEKSLPTAYQTSFMEYTMRRALAVALKQREEIRHMAERTVHDIETKAAKLQVAEKSLALVKLGADLLIATALADDKLRKELYSDIHNRYITLVDIDREQQENPHTSSALAQTQAMFEQMRAEVDTMLKSRNPFHWPIEFPEVFTGQGDGAGFSAVVGNPPFQGGSKITGVLGTDYREYLVNYVANGKRGGQADLCAYFFLRGTHLAKENGMCGLVATNTIAQGDTREVGLDQIVAKGWTISSALSSSKWPGSASLEIARVWLCNGKWQGLYVLDHNVVNGIISSLVAETLTKGKPFTLISNIGKASTGTKIYGDGFILSPEEAHSLISKNTNNKDVLFPYLNGEDLNSRPDQSPSRWVINFLDWPFERAEIYSDCMDIVKARVKPERQRKKENGEYVLGKPLSEKWWLYERSRPELYSIIANMDRVLVITIHAKYLICSWKEIGIVYSNALIIIATESDANFALIQCTFHDEWARTQGSTLETRMRYTSSDCFETFPFPHDTTRLEEIGECYYTHRQQIMLTRQEGLTKTYNRFHDPHELASDIQQLRALHTEMDQAVARAYGWQDLALEHDFHQTKQGLRYTISEKARQEVLDRLLLLNHQRHLEEEQAGLTNSKESKKAKSAKSEKKAAIITGNKKVSKNTTRNAIQVTNDEQETDGDYTTVSARIHKKDEGGSFSQQSLF